MFVCSCASVLMCSCAHVLMCSCRVGWGALGATNDAIAYGLNCKKRNTSYEIRVTKYEK